MKETLVQVTRDFLRLYAVANRPVLLGFSGGVDSSALFSLVRTCLPWIPPFSLHVVHFDHAWRQESAKEALLLEKEVTALGFSFHQGRSTGRSKNNSEEVARKERYAFFCRLYRELNAQGLLLAHQRDDQVETVLKRLFEGAGFLSMGGMQKVSFLETMTVWRPLLEVPRKELIAWNIDKGIVPLEDYTNKDLQFLRPRMREKLLPEIEKWFGKSICANLAHLGKESSELREFIIGLCRKDYEERAKVGAFGVHLTLLKGDSPFLQREKIRFFLQQQGEHLGRKELYEIERSISSASLGKSLQIRKGMLVADQDELFWMPLFPKKVLWEADRVKSPRVFSSFLDAFWQGEVYYKIREDQRVQQGSYQELPLREQKKMSAFLAKNRIPTVLRKLVPCVFVDDEIVIPFDFICNDNLQSCDMLVMKLKNLSN
ncbi:MAG: tRNA lysidine(34) synthetase TilS [Chlamydiae bacterium]|nr:tRNA lysidine(34) synthetase TilS [Chlamydiota bacterium]